MSKDDKSIIDVTQYEKRFFQLNPYLWDSYIGLKNSWANTASCLMSILLTNKRYKDYNDAGEWKSTENRRIYTSICLTPEDILMQTNPVKYFDGADARTDFANLKKRLKELHDGNIFYNWTYRGICMFVMERNIRAWKYYNPKAVMPPRTLKRTVSLLYPMMSRMATFYKTVIGVEVDRVKLENSLGYFVNDMISKMAVSVSDKLPKWKSNTSLFAYVLVLEPLLEKIDDEEGLEEDEGFVYRLPPTVRKKVFEERGIVEEKIMTKLDMEKIIPKNGNLGDKKRRNSSDKAKEIKNKVDPTASIEAQPLKYEIAINPFENATKFVKFFQKGIRSFDNKAMLPNIGTETTDAGSIMDRMTDGGRKGDREFLLSWMKWHFQYNLKGQKIYNIKHTCIKKFGETFIDYNSSYLSVRDKMNLIPE